MSNEVEAAGVPAAGPADEPGATYVGSAILAAGAGVALAWTARSGALPLLIALAVLQAVLAVAWMESLGLPGRKGGVLLGWLAAAGADTAAMRYPHDRLAPLLVVAGLAVPVLFVHQLSRGAARVRVVASLGAIAALVVVEIALATLVQLRHSYDGGAFATMGSDPAFAVVVALAAAVVVGFVADLVYPLPRFDDGVPRGLFAVVVSVAAAAGAAQLALDDSASFDGGRAVFVGAAVGAVAALVSVAVSFAERAVPLAEAGFARRSRALLGALVPLAVAAPIGYVLCLAVAGA